MISKVGHFRVSAVFRNIYPSGTIYFDGIGCGPVGDQGAFYLNVMCVTVKVDFKSGLYRQRDAGGGRDST